MNGEKPEINRIYLIVHPGFDYTLGNRVYGKKGPYYDKALEIIFKKYKELVKIAADNPNALLIVVKSKGVKLELHSLPNRFEEALDDLDGFVKKQFSGAKKARKFFADSRISRDSKFGKFFNSISFSDKVAVRSCGEFLRNVGGCVRAETADLVASLESKGIKREKIDTGFLPLRSVQDGYTEKLAGKILHVPRRKGTKPAKTPHRTNRP